MSGQRSILLLILNVVDVILIFALFYRHALGLEIAPAILWAVRVFGTIGDPLQGREATGYEWVIAQVVCDFTLITLFLSTFVGKLVKKEG